MVRPVRDILGENIPPLRIGEPPKSNGGRAPVGSIQTQVRLLVNCVVSLLFMFDHILK